MRRNFYNSLIMTIPATIISKFLGAINGYVLSKWRFRGSEALFACMTLGVFMPVLFDEPLSNLDAKLRVDMRTEIKKLHSKVGKTTVYVTHDQIEAMTLATRIAVMHQGEIQQFDEPAVVYARPAKMFVAGFMGSPSMNFISATLVDVEGRPAVRIALDGGGFADLPIGFTPAPRLGEILALGIDMSHACLLDPADETLIPRALA